MRRMGCEWSRGWQVGLLTLGVLTLPLTARGVESAPDGRGVLGRRVVDVAGGRHLLGEDGRVKGTALVFLATECPVCREYVPELNRLAAKGKEGSVAVLGVAADRELTRRQVARFQEEFGVAFPLLCDEAGELAAALAPTHAPEVFLVDAEGKIVYRGRIDDRFPKVGQRRTQPATRDFEVALDALTSGSAIPSARTEPVGCPIEAGTKPAAVTFARHIAPILYANCTECHRPGEVAPFSLISYEDAAKRPEWLAEVTGSGLMPPWKAAAGHGDFIGERRLSQRQKELIAAWAAAGAPKGDEADLPVLPKYPDGWQLGEPDLVLEAPHSFTVPASGPDLFHHFVVPLDLPEDKVAVAVEFRPGNPRAVHHSIVFLDQSGSGRKRDEKTPEPGFTTSNGTAVPLAGVMLIWAPGVMARPLPDGVGIQLKKGSDLMVQLHLHPNGKEEVDRSKVGIYFAKKPVERFVMERPFVYGPLTLDIPAGTKRHEVDATMTLPVNLTLTAVLPHMHLIGRELKVWASLPSGEEKPLVWIKDWDFYWQDQYIYREPVRLPKGTKVHVHGVYDNSADNPANPVSPPRRVWVGEETGDEMCLAVFQAIPDDPTDVKVIRNSTFRHAIGQLTNPKVPWEVRAHTLRALRQAGSSEFREVFAELSANR